MVGFSGLDAPTGKAGLETEEGGMAIGGNGGGGSNTSVSARKPSQHVRACGRIWPYLGVFGLIWPYLAFLPSGFHQFGCFVRFVCLLWVQAN